VEIDPIMLEIAEQYFELKQDNRFHVVIDDGLAFVERCRNEGETLTIIETLILNRITVGRLAFRRCAFRCRQQGSIAGHELPTKKFSDQRYIVTH